MISGLLDLKSSGAKTKEAEHDAVRKQLIFFGIML
jgi:hypothetical protein